MKYTEEGKLEITAFEDRVLLKLADPEDREQLQLLLRELRTFRQREALIRMGGGVLAGLLSAPSPRKS